MKYDYNLHGRPLATVEHHQYLGVFLSHKLKWDHHYNHTTKKASQVLGMLRRNLRPKKKNCYVALTRPKFENWVGRSGFFFFFLRTVRELSFPIFLLKFLNGENSGRMQSKRIYKSCKCFFKPFNTNFSKFFAQI